MLKALQFEHSESPTCTETLLAVVASHILRLLLEAAKLLLEAYAPMYKTLIDPPYEFAPKDARLLVLKALQLEHPESLTCTETPLAVVVSHILLLLLEASWLELQAYAPTYKTLIDPPYEFAPKDELLLLLKALQLEHPESPTCTETPLAVVASHILLLLLLTAALKLQAYAPTYKTLIDPPYEFAPKESSSLVLKALQFEHPESLTCTEMPLAVVAPDILRLLLESASLRLQAYAPTYKTLIDPPYEFAPRDLPPIVVAEALEWTEEAFNTRTATPLTSIAPHVLLLLPLESLRLHVYAPT